MIARPIVLVKDLNSSDPMHPHVSAALVSAGYLVLHCTPSQAEAVRVLASCPFTQDDVDALRAMKRAVPEDADEAVLDSIADRIAGMLAQEGSPHA